MSKLDITDEAAVKKAFNAIRDKHGRLDILVNNVGMRDRRGLFEFETLLAVDTLLISNPYL